MKVIKRSALLPHDNQRMFELVNDVESYPRFMDGCVGATVLRREENLLEARLDLSRGGISQSFATRNYLVPAREITMELIDGPFEHFRGHWDFLALGDAGCNMSLDLEFRINNKVLGAAAARLFDKVTNDLVDAVTRRAGELYG